MNQLNFNTKKRNFKHLSEYERGEIYAMIKLGVNVNIFYCQAPKKVKNYYLQ